MNLSKVMVTSDGLESTLQIGETIGRCLKGGEVIELSSDLGGGKTALTKGIALGAGSHELVSSPSFTICNQYKAESFTIYHFDFYRLNDPGIIRQELAESLADEAVVVIIEWPNAVENILPGSRLSVNIEVTAVGSRTITFSYDQELAYLVKGLIEI